MDYIDLEDGQPEAAGIYTVKSQTEQEQREFKAEWRPGNGFIPVDRPLLPEEFIFAWKNA